MRVESYTQVQQLYQSQTISKNQKQSSTGRTDKLQISTFGKDIQTAKAALAGTPDIREELTAPIKARLQKGAYQVDTDSFAEKLIHKYEEMR